MTTSSNVQPTGVRRSTIAVAMLFAAIGLTAAPLVAVGHAHASHSAFAPKPGTGCGGGC